MIVSEAWRNRAIPLALALLFLGASAVTAAPKTGWPDKGGELCWVADADGEESYVRAQVTNMGNGHYLFHGVAYRLPDGALQPFDGNAELNGDSVVGTITKMELRENTLESYSGILTFDATSLDGSGDGVITECRMTPNPQNPYDCTLLRTGPIALIHDEDCVPGN